MRKYLKYIVAVVLVLISVFMAKAQSTGAGCRIGDIVYTQHLGKGTYYGNTNDMVEVYNLNGPTLLVVNEHGYAGYECGRINVYSAGKRWDAPSHSEIPYPAVNEILATTSTVCTASPNTTTTAGGKAYVVNYAVNNPTYCNNTPPMGLPIDDYAWAFVLIVGAIGGIIISRKGILV
ncbi:MAG: hypothetical protein EOO93_25995 [Pedobacter sp.]|nr:MAG: hypothetical protein EOO93_25995 [Pedobacter sp.]